MGFRTPDDRSRSLSPASSPPRQQSSQTSSAQTSPEHSRHTSPDRPSRASLYEQRPQQPPSPSRNKSKKGRPISDGIKTLPQASQHRPAYFKFSLESLNRPHDMPPDMELRPPRLPLAAHVFLQSQPNFTEEISASKPHVSVSSSAIYAGRALAEWTLAVNECQNFFERRRHEGVPSNKLVETPNLGVEALKRPG